MILEELPPGDRFPPFPDEALDPARLDDVVQYLRTRPMPARMRRAWLGKWARFVGIEIDAEHFRRVAGGPAGFEGV